MKELFRLFFSWKLKELFLEKTTNGWIQLFRYCFVGGSAFCIDFFTYCVLEWLGLHYLLSGVFSFIAGFAFNFLVSRKLIFAGENDSESEFKEMLLVLCISILGLLLTEILLFAGIEWLSMTHKVSKICASIIVLFWNYMARKCFVYRR